MKNNEIFQPSEEVYPILAKELGVSVDDLLKNPVFQQIIQKHTNPTKFKKTYKNKNLFEIDGIRILRSEDRENNTIYFIEGLLITIEDYEKLFQSVKMKTQELKIASFNLGYNVMGNKIAGSEGVRVQECQATYEGGWSDINGVSSCTKNAANFLAQYDIFGLQEVNVNYQDDFENYLKSLNPNLQFLSSFYLADWAVVTGYDETVTGPGIMLTKMDESFPYSPGNLNVRGIQAIWFRKINLLFINLHAPHNIILKKEIENSCERIDFLMKKNGIQKIDRVIILGDFNDYGTKLGESGFKAFGFEMKVPSLVKTCCTNSNYKYPGDYIFDSKKNPGYYGLPIESNNSIGKNILMSDHHPIILLDEKISILGQTYEGVINTSGTYVEIQLDINQNLLESMALEYVEKHKLGWKIRKPRAWTDYNSMPHVTLHSSFVKNKGQKVKVKLGETYHFVAGSSRWVAISASLPSPFKCEYECHMSIGQERIVF